MRACVRMYMSAARALIRVISYNRFACTVITFFYKRKEKPTTKNKCRPSLPRTKNKKQNKTKKTAESPTRTIPSTQLPTSKSTMETIPFHSPVSESANHVGVVFSSLPQRYPRTVHTPDKHDHHRHRLGGAVSTRTTHTHTADRKRASQTPHPPPYSPPRYCKTNGTSKSPPRPLP